MPRHNPSLVGAKLSHQSARTPKQIRNLLSRRASSKRFPATITASSSQAFTYVETETIKPARIEESSLSNVRSEHAGGLFVPLVGPETASYEVRRSPRCVIPSTGACATR